MRKAGGYAGTMSMDGRTAHSFLVDGQLKLWRRTIVYLSRKLRNSKVKAYNGNRQIRSTVKIAHWNAGNSNWENKRLEIEALVIEKTPDILFVSEANMWKNLPDHMMEINGYQLHFPQAMMLKHEYARIVLLARDGIEIQIHNEMMHEDLSVIWLSLCYSARKRMMIGGIYREHRLLFKPKPNLTKTDRAQLDRWNGILEGWKLAARNPMCTVIGDINLDFLTWQTPEPTHVNMVTRTKDEIETRGFIQVIRGHTWSWRNQQDSMVDQCWLSKLDRLISWANEL